MKMCRKFEEVYFYMESFPVFQWIPFLGIIAVMFWGYFVFLRYVWLEQEDVWNSASQVRFLFFYLNVILNVLFFLDLYPHYLHNLFYIFLMDTNQNSFDSSG